jgi:hypothetical protein
VARKAPAPSFVGSWIPTLEWTIWPLALGALLWFAFNAGSLYLTYPAPWPDEALFADVSVNLLRHGRLSTDLYADFFPAMRLHYYLTPPLYHVLVAGWFGLWGIGIGALRAFSVLAAAGVMALTYAVGRRVGLSRTSAIVPSTLLALDAVFLRASLLGRMDVLALFLILLTVWLVQGGMAGAIQGRPRLALSQRAFLLGLTSALAVLTHPVGAVAVAISITWAIGTTVSSLSRPHSPPATAPLRTILLPTVLGLALGLLPWALYAFRDLPSFVAQVGGQLQRKSSRHSIASCLSIAASQWGIRPPIVFGGFLAGAFGLAFFSNRRHVGLVLLGIQVLITIIVVSSCEMWYPVYVMPLTYLGIGCAMSRLVDAPMWRRGLSVAFVALALLFAQQNMARVSRIRGPRSPVYGVDAGYSSWCEQIGDALPKDSVVLLDLIPTPYFGLASRSDLTLRLFPPAGFDIPAGEINRFLERMDYVIGGRALVNPEVRSFLQTHGELVAEIGERRGHGYYAAVIKVHR